MNRHDWMNILTKGYKPPKSGNDHKKSKNKLVANQESNKENDITDGLEASTNRKPKSKEIIAKLKQEEINSLRNKYGINTQGSDIPAPIRSVEKLKEDWNVNPKLVENLLKEKYEDPTPIQMQAWPLLLNRREILACAPTGSGKTAAFLTPIIHSLKGHRKRGFRALILAPTRELAKQIVRESDRLSEDIGLRTNVINKVKSGSRKAFFCKIDILVTTPNRLIFQMTDDEFLQQILSKVEWLIVDESDKLFEDGKRGFRDQLAAIFNACSGPNVLRAMFSATLSHDVEQWCKLNLNDVATVFIGTRNSCPDVDQSLTFCACNAGKLMELHELLRKGYEIPCLIFVQTKDRAKSLCQEILLTGRPVQCMHSELSQNKRDEIVREFRQKKVWILICTELMSRGIDFKGVNLVINYDFPPSIVSYVHRVGRTGRAGKKGRAITFWTMDDKPLLRSVGQVMKDSGSEVPEWILSMKSSSTRERKQYAKNLPDRDDDDSNTNLLVKAHNRKRADKRKKPQEFDSEASNIEKKKRSRNNKAKNSQNVQFKSHKSKDLIKQKKKKKKGVEEK